MKDNVLKTIVSARQRKNLTQTEVAGRIAGKLNQTYSLRQYQKLEKGEFPKFKKEVVRALDEILGTSTYEEIYEENVPRGNFVREEAGPSYLEQRRWGKMHGEDYFVPLVPFKARAGYSKAYDQVDYLESLETYQMPPGVQWRGTEWRWFEVGGSSMEPVLFDKDFLLCSIIAQTDWEDIEQFKIYVVVWNNDVSVKRVAIHQGDFILISENEEEHPQIRVRPSQVKEIWKLRRQLNAKFPPTKRFKITA
jgi:phage repressor protein C with HTH and peptisase S24 domain